MAWKSSIFAFVLTFSLAVRADDNPHFEDAPDDPIPGWASGIDLNDPTALFDLSDRVLTGAITPDGEPIEVGDPTVQQGADATPTAKLTAVPPLFAGASATFKEWADSNNPQTELVRSLASVKPLSPEAAKTRDLLNQQLDTEAEFQKQTQQRRKLPETFERILSAIEDKTVLDEGDPKQDGYVRAKQARRSRELKARGLEIH